jgi:hypothetical protein
MIVVGSDLLNKIDDSRGDMSRQEFLNFLYESRLHQDPMEETPKFQDSMQRGEFEEFSHGIRELIRNFLELTLSYGLELGKQANGNGQCDEIVRRMHSLSRQMA